MELEDKYIELIINRCINFNQSKSLLIHCDLKEHERIANKIKDRVAMMEIEDVCILVDDEDEMHEYLLSTSLENIELNPLLDKSKWDIYAKRGAPILFLHSKVPGLMDDIDPKKISKAFTISESTRPYYRQNVSKYLFPWCIAAFPNERWAKTIFVDDANAYEKLYLNIMKMCMIDRYDPVKAWQDHINKNNYYRDKLNELSITKMHYSNSLGTDLEVEIPKNNKWLNIDKRDAGGGQLISNMPSYEIFTSPDYRKTNGVVYSSRPLVHNGFVIRDFSLEFKNGRVVKVCAKEGQEMLEQLINQDEGAMRLGEVALVPYNSPISNTGLVFNDVLFDENASCHLALGHGFEKSFENYENCSDDELIARGLNTSIIHVDFMVGTSDLMIEADTNRGKVLIMKNGEFNI